LPSAKSLLWLTATLAAALLLEASIFRAGWYTKYVSPESATGAVEMRLYWLNRFRPQGSKEMAVIGDSRIAEGFLAPQATRESGDARVHFWNMGIPGTPPRVWYYFLRDADPTRRRFECIAIALNSYEDIDLNDDPRSHVWDLNFLIGRLRLADIWDFARSMDTAANRRAALLGATLKGTVLQQDARDFLNGIDSRLAHVKDEQERGLWFLDNYGGHHEDLTGLSIDWAARAIHFPGNVPEDRQFTIREALLPKLPAQTGETTRYRELWLGRILALYRNSPTRIVFFEISRGPLPQPERQGPQAFLDLARRQPRVIVLDQRAFRDFERPDLYFDGYHFNSKGRALFTTRFTRLLLGAL
jgi:hypothetical protein